MRLLALIVKAPHRNLPGPQASSKHSVVGYSRQGPGEWKKWVRRAGLATSLLTPNGEAIERSAVVTWVGDEDVPDVRDSATCRLVVLASAGSPL